MRTTPKKIIIDTDPGIDDALALFLLLQSPEINIIGITTMFGNHQRSVTTNNALKLLTFYGRSDIPVIPGAASPLVYDYNYVPEFVHGTDALGDINELPIKGTPKDEYAASFMVEQIMAHPNEITLLVIAPLTNLAQALQLEPKIAHNVKEVIIMGGAFDVSGNINPAAEANIYNDPHAAEKVFLSELPITLFPLDVTETVLMHFDYFEMLRQKGGRLGEYIANISEYYNKSYQSYHGIEGGYHHDPLTAMYLIRPELYKMHTSTVCVITEGYARGLTIKDRRGEWRDTNAWNTRKPVNICHEINAEGFLEMFKTRIIGH